MKVPASELFFNTVASSRPANVLKRGSETDVFCEFCKIFRSSIFTEKCFYRTSVNVYF